MHLQSQFGGVAQFIQRRWPVGAGILRDHSLSYLPIPTSPLFLQPHSQASPTTHCTLFYLPVSQIHTHCWLHSMEIGAEVQIFLGFFLPFVSTDAAPHLWVKNRSQLLQSAGLSPEPAEAKQPFPLTPATVCLPPIHI